MKKTKKNKKEKVKQITHDEMPQVLEKVLIIIIIISFIYLLIFFLSLSFRLILHHITLL